MSELTPRKLKNALEEMLRIGLIEEDGDYFKMTEEGREVYLMCKEIENKLQSMDRSNVAKNTAGTG